MLASAWDAEHFLVSTADRVAGTGTLRLFIGVRSSQPSRPPVSIGPWAPLASRGPPETGSPPLLFCRPPWEHLSVQEPGVGQVGRRASVGLGLGAQTWSVGPHGLCFLSASLSRGA